MLIYNGKTMSYIPTDVSTYSGVGLSISPGVTFIIWVLSIILFLGLFTVVTCMVKDLWESEGTLESILVAIVMYPILFLVVILTLVAIGVV